MNSVRQKLRPKHQVLVLKCYPRFQKGVQEVKPNSSELSYLIYYATTRRSKLQKVGAFLEKKAASDVWRARLGNVQVTLQILSTLIEKSPRDLPLYAKSALSIIETVLRSKDITMVEETVPAFETFCKYQDTGPLMADQDRVNQYRDIVKTYADFASKDMTPDARAPMNTPMAIRWRAVGLRAIKSIVSSESLGADGGKQLTIVMPVILQNLYIKNEENIPILHQRVQASENTEMEQARKRRMSIATVATVDTVETNPATAAGSTADADKVAEEEARIVAIRCLKQIFSTGNNRGQIRIATALTLRFIVGRNPPRTQPSAGNVRPIETGNWATSLMEMVTRWSPVQDRFVILLTAMEALVRSPLVEENLEDQLTLTTMIDWLLSSTINLIGLSVMDVLLGLVQHSLLLLQLGGKDSKVLPHNQSEGIDLFQDAKETFDRIVPSMNVSGINASQTGAATASPIRQELLLCLTKCIGSLATHIYYADQISDMIGAILSKLKPSPNADAPATATAIENPGATANLIANNGSLQEDPNTDSFFSFATARMTALNTIKEILLVANIRKSLSGSAPESRNRVGVQVWEGTQWLLRDEDRGVRHGYVDALLAWLRLETNKNDLKVMTRKPSRMSKRHVSNPESILAKRAISSTSKGDKTGKSFKSTFLQLLNLAIYDNAIEFAEVESDVLILHLLLTNLTEKLGVNAVQHGLPMIFRLQEDVKSGKCVTSKAGAINVSSLALGYLWAMSEKFDFETSAMGSQIQYEVSRRKKEQLWLEKIRVPPLTLDNIRPSSVPTVYSKDSPAVDPTKLKPFDNREELVDEIVNAYHASLASPAQSPPSSPGRIFSIPALSYGYGLGSPAAVKPSVDDEIPTEVKEQMLSEWSKELCIDAVERERAKAASLSGSKTGTASAPKNFLAVNGNGNGNESPKNSHSPTTHHHKHHDQRPASTAYGLVGGLGSLQKLRRVSSQQGSPTPITSSSRESTVRVNELKRVLSANVRHASPLRGRADYAKSGTSSESLMTAEFSDADTGLAPADFSRESADGQTKPRTSRDSTQRPISAGSLTSHPVHPQPESQQRARTTPRSDDIPPVPPLPYTLNLPGAFPSDVALSRISSEDREPQPQRSSPPPPEPAQLVPPRTADTSRTGRTLKRKKSRPSSKRAEKSSMTSWSLEDSARVDIGSLLGRIGIEEEGGIPSEGGLSRPPY